MLAAAEHQHVDCPIDPSFVQYGSLIFVDEPELLTLISQILPEVRILSRTDLEGPLVPADWPDLSPYDIRGWRPDNLGEALFNWWD